MAAPVRGVTTQVQPSDTPEALRDVQPTRKSLEDPRGQLREQVLSERGLTLARMMELGPQARIQTEIAIEGEVARRIGAKRLLDIRV